ncbi:hypothetical protein PHMEG_0009045 [Phytophthora megakarya]|uniref:Uncharacterized protein n=1 Tax=Phytophthora megakarya TaxID=4795 RepID=A0A225WH44_9STRA|nr:hypothetical protein PHMEG_0009045 [Phytophthora megakarya]
MDGSRIFNVDETSFESGKTSTEVIALRGSRNVWHTDPTINFHLFIVACVCAAGFVVPPLFILPVERVDNKILEACQYLPGAAVTTTATLKKNITSGFKGCGIYPLSKVNMSAKLTNFQRNGAPVPVKRAAWIRVKEAVQQDMLTLPPPRQTRAKKRKITVSGRILTRELFETEAESVKKTRKQRNPEAQAKCDEVLYVAVVLHL